MPSPFVSDIHAIILTLNEERHIARCIESIGAQCTSVTVIDSGSSDATVSIAKQHGARVITNRWINYATQLNFGIAALSDSGGWLLRIDADEILECRDTLARVVEAAADVDGLLMRRRIYFLNRRIRHGGIEPSWQLRLWRNGRGRCEQRWMDEHIKVVGQVAKCTVTICDMNLNSLGWWTDKHNSYASREAVDVLNRQYGFMLVNDVLTGGAGGQARLRRVLKEQVYARLPGGMRALLYFLYRYFIRFGFLDGRAGATFHVLQGFWYRYLVDAKVAEVKQAMKDGNIDVKTAIERVLGLRVGSD